MGTPEEKVAVYLFFYYIINRIELNSSGKDRKRHFFSKKNGVVSENKAFYGKNTRKNGRNHFCGYKEKAGIEKGRDQRRIVVDFEAEAGRIATVVPVFFALSFACCALS